MGKVSAHQWLGQAIRAADEVPTESTLDAQEFAIHRRLAITLGIEYLTILEGELDATADPTVAAGGALAGQLPFAALSQARFGQQRCGWADLHATSTENARGVSQRPIEWRGYVTDETAVGVIDSIGANQFVANPGAFPTQDTVLVIP